MPRVVISEFIDEDALDDFTEEFQIIYEPSLFEDTRTLIKAVSATDALIVRNRTKVNAQLLGHAQALRVIGRLGVGLENIDLKACATRDILVCPAMGANTQSVVEYVITVILLLQRRAYFSTPEVQNGHWPRNELGLGGEVAGLTLGLLGYGAIAQAVATVARGLGMKIAAYDPYMPAEHPTWAHTQNCTLDQLLSVADVLSVHVPLTSETTGLIGHAALASMKKEAVLINTARGGIVDELALVAALKGRRLSGAALDVFEAEPLDASGGAIFADCPNLILTPHIAGVTAQSNERVSRVTVQNVQNFFLGSSKR